MTHSFSLSTHIRETVTDGMTILSVKTNDSLVTVVGSFPAGRMYDTAHHGVVALLTARMLGESTQTRTKKELHDTLEGMGASVSFDVDTARGRFVASGLATDMHTILALVGEMVREPRFDPDELAVMKTRVSAEILAESDDPKSIARMLLARTLFPLGHPHHIALPAVLSETIEHVTVDDVRTFHRAMYGRGDMILVAGGAVRHDEFVEECRYAFEGIPIQSVPIENDSIVSLHEARRFVHEHMPKKETASVYMGHALSLSPTDPVFDALSVGIHVLGGGIFASRLNQEIREKRGLTYHIRSSIVGYQGKLHGYWLSLAMFPERVYVEGVARMLYETDTIAMRGITTKELTEKKDELLGRFLTQFDNRSGLPSFVLSAYEQGVPITHIDAYPERISTMTVAQVNDSLATHLCPEQSVIASAGDISLLARNAVQKEYARIKKKSKKA